MYKFSKKAINVKVSATLNQSDVIDELKESGRKVIKLNIGEPYMGTPQHIIDATKKALDEGMTRYSKITGLKELKTGICNKLKLENNLFVKNENIIISNGSKQIIYLALSTLLDPDDEVIIVKPYWVTYTESIQLANGIPVAVDSNDDFTLNIKNIENAITSKTKAIIINTPNNPTGVVYKKDKLLELINLCIKKDVVLISDEAYELLTYDGIEHFSPASLSNESFENVITIQTFSKSDCMTGYRVGYAVANSDIIDRMGKMQSHITGNVCTFAQYGAIAATKNRDYSKALREIFNHKKQIAYSLAREIFDVNEPEGAYYLFCEVSKYMKKFNMSSKKLCDYILNETGVAVVDGGSFGMENYVRISFSCSDDELREALVLIKNLLV